MAMIDYGAVVIKNGKVINSEDFFQDMEKAVGWTDGGEGWDTLHGNNFAFIGDPEITIAFYKYRFILCNQRGLKEKIWLPTKNRKSVRYQINGANIHVCSAVTSDCAYLCSMDYKGDHYHVIFGYGIDHSKETWDRIKVRYLGKEQSKQIDKLYNRYIKEEWK